MALTEQAVHDYIKRKLGDGVVCVELTDDQLADAVMRATLWLQQWIGQQKATVITFTNGSEADPPADCEEIVNVIFESQSDSLFDMFRWAGVEVNATDLMALAPNQGYVDIGQRMQYLELGKRMLSADRAWEYDRARRKLVVSPAPASGERVMVFYLSTTLALGYLKSYEQQLLLDYAYAQAMETLGNIRTKFAEVPTASGSTSMNGDTLLANAQSLMDKCEERARQLTPSLPFFMG
jgi:hypothetical protein